MLEHDGRFDWARGELTTGRRGHELLVRRSAVNNADLARARTGALALGLHIQPALIVLFYQLSRELPWSAAGLRATDSALPHGQKGSAVCSSLTIVLRNLEEGCTHHVRDVSLTEPFAKMLGEALSAASGDSTSREWTDSLRRLEERYRSADDAVASCAVTMRLGRSA